MTAVTITDLNNAKLDVDHIASVATSLELTATDRLGHIKTTLSAAVDSIKAFNDRGAWVTATVYAGKDLVSVLDGGVTTWYVCVVAHTSSAAFSTDTASKWRVYQGVTSGDLSASSGASLVGYMPDGVGASETDGQTKLRESITPYDMREATADNGDWSIAINAAAVHAATVGIALNLLGHEWICRNVNFPAGLRVLANGATLKGTHAPALLGETTWIVKLTGDNVVITGELIIDGQKSLYTGVPDPDHEGGLIGAAGDHFDFYSVGTSGHSIDALTCVNAIRNGQKLDGVTHFRIGRHKVHRADRTGCFWDECSHFTVGYFDYAENGYGFGKTKANRADTSHDFLGWASIIRWASHDFTFVDGITRDNGRDGFGIGNGSYRGKVKGQAAFNGDGGFTMFADAADATRTGDNLPPYDLDIDAVAFGNRASGVAIYPSYAKNINVRGVCYNNNAIAGQRASSASSNSGVFFGAYAKNINVDAVCYDNRHTVQVTTAASPVFTCAAWVTGTLDEYACVGVWSSAGVFRGYAKITAETSTTVTLQSPTPVIVDGLVVNDPLTLGDVVVGDYISQATQIYGLYAGQAVIDCSVKPVGWSTNSVFLPFWNATTNGGPYGGAVKVIGFDKVGENLVLNPDFAADTHGLAPANWSASGSVAVSATGETRSVNTIVVTATGTEAYAQVAASVAGQLTAGSLKKLTGGYAKFGALMYSTVVGGAKLRMLVQGAGGTQKEYEVLNSVVGWSYLSVTAFVPTGTENVRGRCVATANNVARVNAVSLTQINIY